MRCKHCGRRIQWMNFVFQPGYVHVTDNGDMVGRYCEIQTAEPADAEETD